jgi:hypothetical protein
MKEYLLHMKSHAMYPMFRRMVLENRPPLIPHDPNNDNTEIWKSLSAQQKGFDLCCALFQLDEE